jgi:hypothetical protein
MNSLIVPLFAGTLALWFLVHWYVLRRRRARNSEKDYVEDSDGMPIYRRAQRKGVSSHGDGEA